MATKDSIYKELQVSVAEAVQPVVNMENAWSPPEMTNRIVRYIYNAVLKELPLSSREAMQNMVDRAMHSFSAACQNKPWFYKINLVNAFVGVIMVVEKQEGGSHGEIQDIESLQHMVRLQYEACQDRILLNRAMWDSVGATFKDDKVAVKVYKALNNTWDSVLEESMAEPLSVPDMTRMQNFIKRWMLKSMSRCWDIVNSENVTLLFENCVRPFGNDHPFSCIPHILYIRSRNLPPKNWSYIRDEAENMFDQWEQMHDQWERKKSAPSMKRPSTSIIDIDHRHRAATLRMRMRMRAQCGQKESAPWFQRLRTSSKAVSSAATLRKRMRATPSALPKRIASAVRKIFWCSTSFLVLVETSIAPHAFLVFAREATMRLDIQTPVRCSCEMPYSYVYIDILDCMPPMLIAKDSTARI